MTYFDAQTAFADLRSALRSTVTTPAPAALRTRAEHRLRRRRAAVAGLAAAAVVAIAAGVTLAARPTAGPPIPPGLTTPVPVSTSASVSMPLPSWSPPAPRPSLSIPARPTNMLTDPIAQTDWAGVTLTIPPREGCPSGEQRFTGYRTSVYPKLVIFNSPIVYGDLTADGAPEAVLELGCVTKPESDDIRTALLVVTRSGGTLRTLGGWVGPIVWQPYRDRWVQDGRLFAEQHESSPGFDFAPGAVAAYRFNGASFDLVPSGLGSFLPTGGEAVGPAIDLGPDGGYIARALNCPGGVLRIPSGGTKVARDGFVYDLDQNLSEALPGVADLAGDGHRYVLAQIICYEATSTPEQVFAGVGVRAQGVLVLDRTAAGFRAVDIITQPGQSIGGWRFDQPGRLTVSAGPFVGAHDDVTWTWNGQYFQR